VITEEAKRSIEQIFEQAAGSRLCPRGQAGVEVTQVDAARHREMLQPHALVLTISSLTFRLLFVLHYADDEATRACYLGADGDQPLSDVLMELVNLCCGSMNQQLVAHFPDLGMSTPYALSSRCIAFIDELRPDQVWTYELRAGEAVRLGATLCVCANAAVDFTAGDMEEQGEGELELF
jgi:hypothetical protein